MTKILSSTLPLQTCLLSRAFVACTAILLFAVIQLSAGEAGGIATAQNYDAAKALAAKHNKAVMLVFTGKNTSGKFWCGPCKALDGSVFQTSDFRDWAKDNVVFLEVILPRDEWASDAIEAHNMGLAEQFKIEFVPTVVFVDKAGNELGRNPTPSSVSAWIKDANTQIAPNS